MTGAVAVDHVRLERTVQALIGPMAAVACRSTADGDAGDLAPVEQLVVRHAVAQRRQEFAAGRWAARDAMRRLGLPAQAVPANADRSPRWPTGVVGSISHCRSTCVAVLARSSECVSVGVDVEPDHELPQELWPTICTPVEMQQLAGMPEPMQARWVTRVFSAKEAYYKWVYPRIRTLLDFHDVTVELASTLDDGGFVAKPSQPQAREATPARLWGSILASQGLVVSLMIH